MNIVKEMFDANAVRNDQSIAMQRRFLQRYPYVRRLLAPIYRQLHAPNRISGFASNLHQRLATHAAKVKQGGTRIRAATLYPPRMAKALMKTKDSMAVATIKLCYIESERNCSNRHDTYESTRLRRWNFRMSLWRWRLIGTSQENARHRALDRDMCKCIVT